MKTSLQMLDAMKLRLGLESDYAIAKHLGFTKSFLSSVRLGKAGFGDESGLIVAHVLNEDPAYILGLLHAERAKDDRARKVWEKVAATFARPLAALLAALGLFATDADRPAYAGALGAPTVLHNADYSTAWHENINYTRIRLTRTTEVRSKPLKILSFFERLI
jgi:hypothetical protein